MKLTPREQDRMTIFTMAEMARRREKLHFTRNDNIIGCPLCTLTPPAAPQRPATGQQQP